MKNTFVVVLLLILFTTLFVFTQTSAADFRDGTYKIPEAGRMNRSINAKWWLSSGAYAFVQNGSVRTVFGRLSAYDPWRVLFSVSNPIDTDFGYRPQNIFRLVSKLSFQNSRQEMYVRVHALNLSDSPNRAASNGVFFFNRYQDEQTVYYTGIRVDGYAVIKKKVSGTYTTLAYKRIINGTPYDRASNPSLLPSDSPIGLRSDITTLKNGYVDIRLYVDIRNNGEWARAAQALDDGSKGGAVISNSGHAGIRTDFMDAEFVGYSVQEL